MKKRGRKRAEKNRKKGNLNLILFIILIILIIINLLLYNQRTEDVDLEGDLATLDLIPESQENLIAYYKFDRNARDSVGNNHGSVRGSPDYVEGVFGKAIKLYGSQDYVEIGDKFDSSLRDEFTIATWIKLNPGALGTSNYVFWKSDDNPGLLILEDGRVDVKPGPRSTTKLEEGKWYHIVYIYNQTHSAVYVNGIFENVGAVSFSPGGKIYIGRDEKSSRYNRYFNGVIDDVMVFDRALSEAEIEKLLIDTILDPFAAIEVTRTITNSTSDVFQVTLDINVNEKFQIDSFIIQEHYPWFWEVVDVSYGGYYNDTQRLAFSRIEWLAYNEDLPIETIPVADRTVSYRVRKTNNDTSFHGKWMTSEAEEEIGGEYEI